MITLPSHTPVPGLSPIEEILAEATAGRMVVLADDEDRENEGDLVIPAAYADAQAINFMARHGRGLICLALEEHQAARLQLRPMAQQNQSRLHTAFTVSIEAREGISTGISAADRARTIAVATRPDALAQDVVSPGHVFPIIARPGGVLVRAGHTEAAVDIARLAGHFPAGVMCEIMNEDGSMARLPDLLRFAQAHGLKVGTISDLIAYRRRNETLVERRYEGAFDSLYGGVFQMIVYASRVGAAAEHVALIKGDIRDGAPVPVRMHALNVLEDVLGFAQGTSAGVLHAAMRQIAAEGRGVIVLLREAQPTALSTRLNATPGTASLRDYGLGAQILRDLGVGQMLLLSNNPKPIPGLDGFDLQLIGHIPIKT